MPHFVQTKDKGVQNMNDITSDFPSLKVSVLQKASRISGEIFATRISQAYGKIIKPHLALNKNDGRKSENIENEQNSCNIKNSQNSFNSQNNKTSAQNGITFSVKKLLMESELQRKEEVRKEIDRHWQKMIANGRVIQEHIALSRSQLAKERERKTAEALASIREMQRIADQEEIRRRREYEKEVLEYRKRMKEKELQKRIATLRDEFGTKYNNLIALSESCKDKNAIPVLFTSYGIKPIKKVFCQHMEIIDEKIRTGELVAADLNITDIMVHQIDEVLNSLRLEIGRINAQYEANIAYNAQAAKEAQEQTEALKEQEPEIIQNVNEVVTCDQANLDNITQNKQDEYQINTEPQREIESTDAAGSPNVPEETPTVIVNLEETVLPIDQNEGHLYNYVDKESLQMYISSQQFLDSYVRSYVEFLQSPSTKKFRFECQKAINIPVNAISGISEQHLRDKYERLHSLLIEKSTPNVGQYSQGAAFCKDILAKKIVSQGETLVSSKPKMAFPIAAIIVSLWNDHPDFGDLLLAHFHNVCPFTVPLFIPKIEGQSNEDYYKSMGYKYAEDGTVEKHDKYLKRMSGMMRLYASIAITPQRKGIPKTHPHGLQNAWRWLAAVLNTEPRADMTDLAATLILDMLEVAGSALWCAYPRQFHKLLLLLTAEFYPRMKSVGCIGGGPLVRLEEFLKNCLTKGSIPPPEGLLPSNFW